MDVSTYMILSATGCICILGAAVFIKALINKKWPSSIYTPFDNITAQSPIEFHEEKQEREVDDSHGDDKNKNFKYAKDHK